MVHSDEQAQAGGAHMAAREDDIAFRIIDLLLAHGLSTAPLHYAVAHAHLDGSHPAISAAIDAQRTQGKPFDACFMAELYEEHLAAEAIRHACGVGSDVARLLDGLLDQLQQADAGSSNFKASLDENIGRLDPAGSSQHLKTVAQRLLEAALKASESNDVLKQNLEVADQEARQLRSELARHRRETLTDPLTGLLNRRGMELEMARVFADEADGQSAMLVLDIDHFKHVNDTYGHAVGDVVIRKVAQAVRQLIPEGAVPVRYGGEEFAVLLPPCSPEQACGVAEKIRRSIEKLRLVRRHDKLAIAQFTLSVGVAMRALGDDLEGLFQRADQALYRAKSGGRNQVMLAA
ncbi:GGDEF domain-containing protein [Denitromonas iodatirespirans]|uniref:diguanylate cyclase n=1 Tax=Denitromonas iodatirespirans TaxID=2795389 RepID=A0A944DC18_DENI1|nr:GGDEF domain-containing protein [Denitromonas iodatirespirans]MBT0962271.1 GGDEF domain-containing protein [Denitromonas iodatirespirans]